MLFKVSEVGYDSGGEFKKTLEGKSTKCYIAWCGMIRRCYDAKSLEKYPTYSNVRVCETWFDFQVFAKWWYDNSVIGWHFDKDLLSEPSNKIYSANTCCFLPKELNAAITIKTNKKSGLPHGVKKNNNYFHGSYTDKNGKFILKSFKTKEEAFKFSMDGKKEKIYNLAEIYKNELAPAAYLKLLQWGYYNDCAT